MSCSPAPDAPSVACMEGTATLTMLTSITAIIWPASTMARAAPGDATRPGSRPLPGLRLRGRRLGTAGRALSVRSVMATSLRDDLCWYQEPGYPGTNTTWHGCGLLREDGRREHCHRQQRAPDRAGLVPALPARAGQPGGRRPAAGRPP